MSDQPKRKTNTELLRAFKKDLNAADTKRLEMVAIVEGWRAEYNGEKYGNEVQGKSELVSRDIKRQDEWQHASVKDPFVSDEKIVKCSPVTFEDRKAAEQNELVLNYQFTRQFNRYKFMTDAIKLYYSEGTVIVKTSWDYEDEIVKTRLPIYSLNPETMEPDIIGMKEVDRIKVLQNRPEAQICRIEDVYLDPTAEGDLDNAQFVIHRYESDLSSLRKSGKYKNLRKLVVDMAINDGDDFRNTDDTEFLFADKARKKLIVYEYWGNYDVNNDGIAEPIICTWVNDTVIQLETNPYPDKKLPFLIVANNSIPFHLYGEAYAELVGDNQKISTAIKRGFIDNMANSNNGQKGIKVNALDPLNKKRFLNGRNFEFQGEKGDFFEGNYNQIPGSAFSILEMTQNETESMTGVKGFANGIGGAALGSTARAAGGVLDAVSVRRLDIVRNIAENLIKPLMRKWMSYNSEFLQEEEVIRITNEEFIPVKRDDLTGAVDIQIEVSTAEDNSAKAQELSFLLQTLGQQLDPEMMKLLMSQISKLHKMPDLAKQITEFQPQPDPFAEEVKKWELRKLIAEVKERESRADENMVDMRAKNARAAVDEAKVGEIKSNTDLKDLDFTRKATGAEHDEKMMEMQHNRVTQAGIKHMENKEKARAASS